MSGRSDRFLSHLATTQEAYRSRDLQAYLSGFAEDYRSVQLGHGWSEDKSELGRKVGRDIDRFEVLAMDFEVLQHWFAGRIGFAYLQYSTHLKVSGARRTIRDRRRNLIVAEEQSDRSWKIISKVVLEVVPPDHQ